MDIFVARWDYIEQGFMSGDGCGDSISETKYVGTDESEATERAKRGYLEHGDYTTCYVEVWANGDFKYTIAVKK